jgi:dihydroflavonol-4-reductase
MRILVTGAAGFIGRNLVRRLVREGHEVVALDRVALGGPGLDAADWRVGDLGDASLIRAAVAGCDRVHHLAAAHLDQSTPAEEYERVNIAATVALLEAAAEAGVARYLHCSSVGVFGDVRNPPVDEDGPKNPGNVYEETKLAGEQAVLARAAGLEMNVVVVRPAWVYGADCPRTRKLLDMVRRGKFFYFGSGGNLRHPIHIEDCLDGLEAALEKGGRGRVYNLAGPSPLTLREMIETMASAVGAPPPRLKVPLWFGWCVATCAEAVLGLAGKTSPLTRRSLVFFSNSNAYATRRASDEIGFTARTQLEEGLRRSLEEGTPAPAPVHRESRAS